MLENQKILADLQVTKEFFIGIDSDGCVFDTMEIKQKECFCPNFIKYFNLQALSKAARETWEFVNLYSQSRGCNRFLAVAKALDLLKNRKETALRNAQIPDFSSLLDWLKIETKLGNPSLEKYLESQEDKFMAQLFSWSKKVNEDISSMVFGMPPFPYVRESLEKMLPKADMIVVSQTPYEALHREWDENNMMKYIRLIAGQELGTKTEHLQLAAKGKYEPHKILMIGDAPGDLKAANDNNALFFPINPGFEDESWNELLNNGLNRFFSLEYFGEYQNNLIQKFMEYLPEKPHWH